MSIALLDVEPEESLEIEKDEEYRNKYLFCKPLDYHLMSESDEIESAVRGLLEEIGYELTQRDKAFKTMRMLVCNLFRSCRSAPSRYLRTYLSKNGIMNLQRRYNKLEINYVPLKKCIDGLAGDEYIEHKCGYFNNRFGDGYQTRIRATRKLIAFLESHEVELSMIFEHPEQELIIRRTEGKDKRVTFKKRDGSTRRLKVKVKYLDDYTDTKNTDAWRNFLWRYINFLKDTYIDIDLRRYSPDPENPIGIELYDKIVHRIFSHSTFAKGGRFYGGFWQQLSEGLRERIIINGHHVVEVDFSGMMVHILYAFVGKKLGGHQPYVVAKGVSPDQDKLRELYKKLLVVGCNADKQRKAIEAVRDHVRSNPEKYPAVPDDDKECYAFLRAKLDELRVHHPDIKDYFCSGEGIRTQRVDSDIAYKVLVEMTGQSIPVLCIHDSFICRADHRDTVLQSLKDAYVDVINQLLVRKKHELRVTEQDVFTKETSILTKRPKYMFLNRNSIAYLFNALWRDDAQIMRQRTWKRNGTTQFYNTVKA